MLKRFCIIGAGASGLAVAKNFAERGILFDCFERQDDVGGNWYYGKPCSRVCRSTHLISSKRMTEMRDFPMPDDYPEYPSHQQAWDYLRDYAEHFNLYENIEFGRSVEQVERVSQHAALPWKVTLDRGEVRQYAGVVIANGHNWDPKWPSFNGEFAGTMLHSADYKTPEVLVGKRVLVVGAGNSGCDIAVESAQNAAATFQSVRRGYHYLPKFVRGKPIDQLGENLLRLRVPLWIRRAIAAYGSVVTMGRPQNFGLPKPDHKLFETHPIINSQMLYYAAHGKITPKPDIVHLAGNQVCFADDTAEVIDVIICATGYRIAIPFIDPALLNWHNDKPELFLNAFHPTDDTLFIAGLIQPDSGQWGIVDDQARLMAAFIVACDEVQPVAEWFRRLKSRTNIDLTGGIRYLPATRHLLEVEHFSYRRRLQQLVRKFERARVAAL
jgi:hypothetical protein